jgi:solute carrier family 35, member F1/2
MGMWGTLINGIQAAGLEHQGMKTVTWDGFNSKHSAAS